MLPYDDKGKIFTEVVSKEPVSVTIQTALNRIEGTLHTRPGERVKDELNREERFVAVTDAVVFDLAGVEVQRGKFLALNRDAVQWVLPRDEAE